MDAAWTEAAVRCAKSFPACEDNLEFNAPKWQHATNPHVQTLLGFVFPRPPTHLTQSYQRDIVQTSDGDRFALDTLPAPSWSDAKHVVIVVGGTESSSSGPYTLRLAAAVHERLGWTARLINYRGCGGLSSCTPRHYHLGFTDDLRSVVERTAAEYDENASIFLIGVSLGGNVVLKYLGEDSSHPRAHRVCGAAVACVPFKPASAQFRLNSGMSRAVYVSNFLRTLKPKAVAQYLRHPGSFDLLGVLRATTIREYDEYYTAPVFGFKSAMDYYDQTNVLPVLSSLSVPTIVVNSLDDPVLHSESFPSNDDREFDHVPVVFKYTHHGGHLGFVCHDVLSGRQRLSFLGRLLTQFLAHVDSYLSQQTVPRHVLSNARKEYHTCKLEHHHPRSLKEQQRMIVSPSISAVVFRQPPASSTGLLLLLQTPSCFELSSRP